MPVDNENEKSEDVSFPYRIVCSCGRPMTVSAEGVTCRISNGYLVRGDRYTCPECKATVYSGFGKSWKQKDGDRPFEIRLEPRTFVQRWAETGVDVVFSEEIRKYRGVCRCCRHQMVAETVDGMDQEINAHLGIHRY